jgi:hypothetical protein
MVFIGEPLDGGLDEIRFWNNAKLNEIVMNKR